MYATVYNAPQYRHNQGINFFRFTCNIIYAMLVMYRLPLLLKDNIIMSTLETIIYCPCCGRDKPAYDYPAGKHICSICANLDADTAVFLTRETVKREYSFQTHTKVGRKQARIAAKMEIYATTGKRCSACHHYKPVKAYDRCAPQPDGLQPNCKTCNNIWRETRAHGGKAAWHQVRDALRAASPEGK